ncbi:sugar ABC transporter permease [Lysobacter daejeonensis GH1-9]|uniref:Transport permease protein n=1 Tax=Lysobacter daejeonensis GH1-9 TaxID=1385517 RepID=A0A0A0F108_9GAMM|nr:ABC transporter permease [Lysobacter daejeonensis]KGM55112.1 sugar ABC transporter permease [Lysobacter daejeonensis GH1-9]
MSQYRHRAASPLGLVRSLRDNRELIVALTRREVVGRYRGSVIGLAWSFLYPLLMLAVYTFVFSVVFKARWPGGQGSKTEFALVLFTGLMVYSVFSECVNRAPSLVLNNVNYVKKVVFPLEILAVVSFLSALFHMLVSVLVWTAFYLCYFGIPPVTALLLPVVLAPLVLLTLGLSWLLASLGVYLRDVGQAVGIFTTVLMFMSPIFYAVESLPKEYWPIMHANPLTTTITQARQVMIWGQGFDPGAWTMALVLGGLVAWMGYAWFQVTRKGFADVL